MMPRKPTVIVIGNTSRHVRYPERTILPLQSDRANETGAVIRLPFRFLTTAARYSACTSTRTRMRSPGW